MTFGSLGFTGASGVGLLGVTSTRRNPESRAGARERLPPSARELGKPPLVARYGVPYAGTTAATLSRHGMGACDPSPRSSPARVIGLSLPLWG